MSRKNTKPMNGIILVADVGLASSKILPNSKTYVEQTKECICHLIQNKIFIEDNDEVSIILFGTVETENPLHAGKSQYKHVKVLCEMNKPNWGMAQNVDKELRSTQCQGDWLDALGVALDTLHKRTEDGVVYVNTQIVFFTPFESPFVTSDATESAYVAALLDQQTDIVFIGSNINSETKPLSDGEKVASRIIEEANGSVNTFDELLRYILYFPEKSTKPMPWNSTLEIGPSIKIPISAFIKVKKKDDLKWQEETSTESLIERERTYHKGPASSIAVHEEDIVNGYKYGSRYIPFTRDEEQTLTYKSGNKCFTFLAFVDPIPSQFYAGNSTMYVFSQRKAGVVDRNAQIALSAFIVAMEETGKVALVRRVYSNNTRVRMGVLSPRIKLHYECLVYHELPFADDYRQFEFAPIINPKHKPTADQLNAMDQLIDNFDLLAAEKRNEVSLSSKSMYDPYSQYLRIALASKAIRPDDPIPEMPAHIKMLTEPPPTILNNSRDLLERIKELFPLEIVDHKRVNAAEAQKRELASDVKEEAENPMKKFRLDETGELDLSAILGTEVTKIGTAAPMQDFLELLKKGKKSVKEICTEMEAVIIQLLLDSVGSNAALMTKACDCLKIYRQKATAENWAQDFNSYMERFKALIVSNSFYDFWQQHIVNKIGLITSKESSASDVSEEAAGQFIRLSPPAQVVAAPTENDDDLLDLL